MEESGPSAENGKEAKNEGGSRGVKVWMVLVALLLVCAVVFLVLYLAVWRSSGSSEKNYEKNWRAAMEEFDERSNEDEKKATSYMESENLSAVIVLVRERIEYIEGVIEQLLELNPPAELRRLHVATLYYLLTEIDQLKARNDLNVAILKGDPTTDLKTIADNAIARSQQAFREFSIEVQDAGLTLEEESKPVEQESDGQETTPSGEDANQQGQQEEEQQ